jgi:hypothetical protein
MERIALAVWVLLAVGILASCAESDRARTPPFPKLPVPAGSALTDAEAALGTQLFPDNQIGGGPACCASGSGCCQGSHGSTSRAHLSSVVVVDGWRRRRTPRDSARHFIGADEQPCNLVAMLRYLLRTHRGEDLHFG